MNFVKSSFYSGIATAVTIVTRLITNKVVAVFMGADGLAILGQFKDFINIILALSHLGTEKGSIKYIAGASTSDTELKNVVSTGFKVHLFSALIVGLFTFLFKDWLSSYLLGDAQYHYAFAIAAFSIVAISIYTFMMALLNGLRYIKEHVTVTIIVTLITGTVMVLLVYYLKLKGALMALVINQFLVLFIVFIYFKIKKSVSFALFTGSLDRAHLKKLLRYSAMFLTSALCLSLSLIFVRKYLSVKLGLDYAGYWEGMWRISAMYLMFLTSSFGLYLLPTFSLLETDKLRKEIFKVWKFVLPIVLSMAAGIFLLKDFIIQLLFTEEFLAMGVLFLFQLSGDVIKVHSWVLGNVLVAKAKSKVFIGVQIGWTLVFCSLAYWLVDLYGLQGVSIAYCASYLLHFIFMNLYFRKLLWMPQVNRH